MNQVERMNQVIERTRAHVPLEPVPMDPELQEADSLLKILKVRCHNWRAEKLRKIGTLRFFVNLPPLDALNMIFYPKENVDAPIFILFFLETRRKLICHININTPSQDPEYLKHWVGPMEELRSQYPSFEAKDRYPEWMKKYRHPCTVYGLFPKDSTDDLSRFMFDCLEAYASRLAGAPWVENPDRLRELQEFHTQWIDDIRTQDKAQGMISKFIGKAKARRIFHEVST